MEEGKEELTSENCLALMKIFSSKKKEMTREQLCEIIGISENNTSTYSRIIKVLEGNSISTRKPRVMGYYIVIDRRKLENFLLQSGLYKLVDTFIHCVGFGWSTP